MSQHVLIGCVLLFAALCDVVVGGLLISRAEDPKRKMILGVAMGSGSLFMAGLGLAFLAGVIPLQ